MIHFDGTTRSTKPIFGRWLLAQTTRSDAVGHLALCASRDPKFPRDGSVDKVSCHLNACGADGDLHNALEDAALDYQALPPGDVKPLSHLLS